MESYRRSESSDRYSVMVEQHQIGPMAKSSKFLTPETLRRTAKGGALVWNPEPLDWPLRPLAEPEEMDEIRNLILKYLDDMAQGESGRTRREIRREMVRAFRRLYEIVMFFQKVFQRAEDVACGKRDFRTGKLVRPSRRKVVKKIADDDIPF